MPRFDGLVRMVGVLALLLWVGLPASQTASLPNAGLMGTVKSPEGKPMEGVAVSARSQDKTYTTSVYTNRDGEYYFPALEAGQYRVWAQAVGYETARSEQRIATGKKIQQNFALRPMRDFSKQLSAAEWLDSLPESTPEDRRMKRIVHYNCNTCHIPGFPLQKRFDAAGWGIILNTMLAKAGGPNGPNGRYIQAYKEELIQYLTRVRGPEPSPMKFKAFPRVTGEAAEIVVTDYDLPWGDRPDYIMDHNGSDWSEGIPSKYEGGALHDAVVGKNGNVYFSDPDAPGRTIGKLDPKTGRVTSYKLAGKDGFPLSTHGAIVDQKGNIWFTNGTEGAFLKFDPETEQFQRYPRPDSPGEKMGGGEGGGRLGGTIAVDSKGNVWGSARDGAVRLNPETGAYTEYKGITPRNGAYGITVDSEDNAWIAELAADRLMVVNGRSGEVSEVALAPLDIEVSAKDREIGQRNGIFTNAAPLSHKGPRRLKADINGDSVWVAEYWVGKLAKVDIHTRKITEYALPSMYSQSYAVAVDKNHMVWVSLMNSDRIAKFNPFTEQFTEYPLPSLGTEARFIDVDNSTDVPTVWVPYSRDNKIGRVQFRMGSANQLAAKGR